MILTVGNNKGGVGKTALAAHLVFRAAEQLRVLAVDLDGQANLTATLIERSEKRGHDGSDLLFTGDEAPQPMRTPDPNIDLLPAGKGLNSTDRLNLSAAFEAIGHLKKLAGAYDLVVIDTPPAIGLRMTAALACARQVVVPLVPESYSVDGVSAVLAEIAGIAENLNTAMRPAQFVLNLVNPQARQHRRIGEQISERFPVVQPWLNRSVAVAEALAERRPVWKRPTSTKSAQQWRALTGRLLVDQGLLREM
jgi:chromosome partitioning protein